MNNLPSRNIPRFKVFVDYWNFQLLINEVSSQDKVPIDWKQLGQNLTKYTADSINIKDFSYEGMNVYTSYDPNKDRNTYFKWINNWLNKQTGVQVYCLERKPKRPPFCPSCHNKIEQCPHCNEPMKGNLEKGVDALIVTDLIRLAWENAYDIAILVSCDRDLIPGVKFIDAKCKKVIHAGFPPIGSDISNSCWASINLKPKLQEIIRQQPQT